jgi:hypothetical protein
MFIFLISRSNIAKIKNNKRTLKKHSSNIYLNETDKLAVSARILSLNI